jgi:tetratricopeptide (TPR) repeat protein
LRRSLAVHEQLDSAAGQAIALQRLGVVVTALGRWDEARQLIERGIAIAERANMRTHCLVRLYASLGRNRIEAGEYAAARKAVDTGLSVEAAAGRCLTCSVMLYPAVAVAYAGAGEIERGREFAATARELAHQYAINAFFLGLAYQATGMVEMLSGDYDRSLAAFREARAYFQTIPQAYEVARTNLMLAFAHVRRGRPSDFPAAVRLLGTALPVFIQHGASASTGQTRSMLRQLRAMRSAAPV